MKGLLGWVLMPGLCPVSQASTAAASAATAKLDLAQRGTEVTELRQLLQAALHGRARIPTQLDSLSEDLEAAAAAAVAKEAELQGAADAANARAAASEAKVRQQRLGAAAWNTTCVLLPSAVMSACLRWRVVMQAVVHGC